MTDEADKTFAIRIISNIIEKSQTLSPSPENIFKTIRSILNFWRLIPPELKEKASEIIKKLWKNEEVALSTDPEHMREDTEIKFSDQRIEKLYLILPDVDRATVRYGQRMLDLRNRGFEDQVVNVKSTVCDKYGCRGLTIVHLVTTEDLNYFFNESENLFGNVEKNKEQILRKFNKWVEDYLLFTLLIDDEEIEDLVSLEEKIIWKIKEMPTEHKYFLVHTISTPFRVSNVHFILNKLKEEKKVNYRDLSVQIKEKGFLTDFSARLTFD